MFMKEPSQTNILNLSFFTDEIKTVKNNILPKNISNEFRKIKMAYYQDNEQTPIFEQTVLLNDQGIAIPFNMTIRIILYL